MRWLPLALLACGTDPVDDAATGLTAEPDPVQVFALNRLDFERQTDGVSRGFDLDGQDGACGIDDYAGPGGESGIDNSFAELLPLMETAGGAAFEDLIQGTVDSGEFLLLTRLEVVGDCVVTDIYRAASPPLVGADGELLAGQTLPVREGGPILHVDCATWEDDDTLVATGLTLPVEIEIFGEAIAIALSEGAMRLHLSEDGTAWGEVGGGIDVDDLWAQIGPIGGIGTQLLALLEGLLFLRADMAPEGGDCTHMSAVMAFEAQPAFLHGVE